MFGDEPTGSASGEVKKGHLEQVSDFKGRKPYYVVLSPGPKGPELELFRPKEMGGKPKKVLWVDFACDDLIGLDETMLAEYPQDMLAFHDAKESEGRIRVISGRDTFFFAAGSVEARNEWITAINGMLRGSMGDAAFDRKADICRQM